MNAKRYGDFLLDRKVLKTFLSNKKGSAKGLIVVASDCDLFRPAAEM